MPSRHELNLRARALGFDPTTIVNDSKLEQKVLWLEKNATTFAGTSGTGTLTSDNTELTDGDTVTIGAITYRFKDTPAQAYDVKRDGTTADTTLGYLVKAINSTGTPGTEYFAGTVIHPLVTAGAVTAHATTLTVKDKAVTNGDIATTETSSHLSFGAATISSGVGAVIATGATIDAQSVRDSVAGMAGDKNVTL